MDCEIVRLANGFVVSLSAVFSVLFSVVFSSSSALIHRMTCSLLLCYVI